MKRFLMLAVGMSLVASPAISKSDDETSGAELTVMAQIEAFVPPANLYALSTIGRTIKLDGEELRCYTVKEGTQVLMPMFADYRALYKMAWLWVAARNEYNAKIMSMGTKLRLHEGTIAFYKDESEHWYKVSESKDARLRLSERWSWVPWALLSAGSVAVGIVGLRSGTK